MKKNKTVAIDSINFKPLKSDLTLTNLLKESKEGKKYVIEIVAVGNNLYKVSISIDDGGLLEVRTMSLETFIVGTSGLVLKMR